MPFGEFHQVSEREHLSESLKQFFLLSHQRFEFSQRLIAGLLCALHFVAATDIFTDDIRQLGLVLLYFAFLPNLLRFDFIEFLQCHFLGRAFLHLRQLQLTAFLAVHCPLDKVPCPDAKQDTAYCEQYPSYDSPPPYRRTLQGFDVGDGKRGVYLEGLYHIQRHAVGPQRVFSAHERLWRNEEKRVAERCQRQSLIELYSSVLQHRGIHACALHYLNAVDKRLSVARQCYLLRRLYRRTQVHIRLVADVDCRRIDGSRNDYC